MFWSGKKARVAYDTLSKHKFLGGAGLPNLTAYLWASRIDQLKHWFTKTDAPIWSIIEEQLVPTKNLQLTLISDLWIPCNWKNIPISIKASLQAWRAISKVNPTINLFASHPITTKLLIPKIRKVDTNLLSSYGLSQLTQFYDKGILMQKEDVVKEFHLPASTLLSISKILLLLAKHPIIELPVNETTWNFLSKSNPKNKGISLLYSNIYLESTSQKSVHMIKWEETLNQNYTIKQWQTAIKSIYKYSKCTNHWEMTIKIVNRWHFTPYRLAKISSSISPLCWRECGRVGSLQHILWDCPSIISFWNSIFNCIASCTGILSPPKAALAILNLNIDNYPMVYRQLVTHILLAARTLILCNWKSTLIPNLSETISLVNNNYAFEKALAINNLTFQKFQKSRLAWPYAPT